VRPCATTSSDVDVVQQSIFSACLFPLLNVSSFIHKNDGNSAQFSCKWIPTDDYIYFCERWMMISSREKRAKTAPTLEKRNFIHKFSTSIFTTSKNFFMNETQDFTALIPSNVCEWIEREIFFVVGLFGFCKTGRK
jgi:hypothetical protein